MTVMFIAHVYNKLSKHGWHRGDCEHDKLFLHRCTRPFMRVVVGEKHSKIKVDFTNFPHTGRHTDHSYSPGRPSFFEPSPLVCRSGARRAKKVVHVVAILKSN